MAEAQSRSSEHDDAAIRNEEVRAWRENRRNKFETWLERSHEKIVTHPAFQGLLFPGEHSEFRVKMATQDGAEAVLGLLRDARAEGIEVDPDRFVIVRDSGNDEAPFVVQAALRVSTPSQTAPTPSQGSPTGDPSFPSPERDPRAGESTL